MPNPERNAYFGDLHVHARFSFDAFIFGTRATPDDAYRYAKGEAVMHPAGIEMKMPAPLDFQAVTDHDIYLGMLPEMADPESKVGKHPVSEAIRAAKTPAERREAFSGVIARIRGQQADDLYDLEVSKAAWQEIIAAAERHNAPGKFTTFIGYEHTKSGPDAENLHRNVIYRGSLAPEIPFTASMSNNPEDLWNCIYIYLLRKNRARSEEIIRGTRLHPSTVRELLSKMYDNKIISREKIKTDRIGKNPYLYGAVSPLLVVTTSCEDY